MEAKNKALRNNTLDQAWKFNVTQFCQTHYMSYSKKNKDTDMMNLHLINYTWDGNYFAKNVIRNT